MAYARDDIDRVRAASSLVDLAAEVTKVKKSGRSVMAVCPFHREKTPSLSIDAERGLYHCFGCGKSGDVFRWVQETHGVDFVGALELLARRAGIQLQEEPGAARRRGKREELVAAVEVAVAFYHERLRTAPDAGGARSYLRGRGYEVDVVDRFVIGYSPAEWDVLTRKLRADGLSEEALVGAGLAVKSRTGRLVDRFRGRLMFPIYDLRGDAVGFGARLLDGDGPKYLNSPETAIYQKSRLLYGLNWAKGDIVRSGRAVVVEGYTDVIAFHLAGDPVAVATCGTALGEDHLDLLRRFTERVVLAFDADAAGAGAALRGFEVAVPGDLDLRVALMPEGRDPADLVAAGRGDLLAKAVEESEPLLQFRIERELERFDLDEAEARGRAVRSAAAVIARHPDALIRHEYAVVLARRTGVDLAAVENAVGAAVRSGGAAGSPRQERPQPERLSGQDKVEREVLRLLLANDPSVRSDELTADLFARPEHAAAYELVAPAVLALEPGEPPDLGTLIGDDESATGRMLRELALTDRPLESAVELIIRLKRGVLERRIDEVRRDLERLDAGTEPEEYSSRFAELIALERRRQELRRVE
jgi:DNA primase